MSNCSHEDLWMKLHEQLELLKKKKIPHGCGGVGSEGYGWNERGGELVIFIAE